MWGWLHVHTGTGHSASTTSAHRPCGSHPCGVHRRYLASGSKLPPTPSVKEAHTYGAVGVDPDGDSAERPVNVDLFGAALSPVQARDGTGAGFGVADRMPLGAGSGMVSPSSSFARHDDGE